MIPFLSTHYAIIYQYFFIFVRCVVLTYRYVFFYISLSFAYLLSVLPEFIVHTLSSYALMLCYSLSVLSKVSVQSYSCYDTTIPLSVLLIVLCINLLYRSLHAIILMLSYSFNNTFLCSLYCPYLCVLYFYYAIMLYLCHLLLSRFFLH